MQILKKFLILTFKIKKMKNKLKNLIDMKTKMNLVIKIGFKTNLKII